MKTKRLGNYRYEITDNGVTVGLVSVCRCGNRSQWYQVQLPDGTVLKEYSSVRKAAEAAMKCRTNTAAPTATATGANSVGPMGSGVLHYCPKCRFGVWSCQHDEVVA